MNSGIISHQQRIDSLFSRISSLTDPRDQSEWSKYLCILVSGFIEESIKSLIIDYSRNNSSPHIQEFISQEIKELTNCKTSKIEAFLNKFSERWKDEFTRQISQQCLNDEIKNSLDSIIANRNKIAHGKNTGLSYAIMSGYYTNAKKAIFIIDSILQ